MKVETKIHLNNGFILEEDKHGNLDITENVDKISTLIPLLSQLQELGYEEICVDFCYSHSITISRKK